MEYRAQTWSQTEFRFGSTIKKLCDVGKLPDVCHHVQSVDSYYVYIGRYIDIALSTYVYTSLIAVRIQ